MTLRGNTALVTGASSGLGQHFARLLAAQGAEVILAARRREALDRLCADIAETAGAVVGLPLDVTDADAVKAAIAGLPRPPDILINAAGISAAKPALELSCAEWDCTHDTNLRGAFLVARAVAERLVADGRGGTIVNVASILGHRVAGNLAAYAASKAGLVRLTEVLAVEWARHGIRVNTLCPGYIETDLNREFFQSQAGQALIKRIPQRRLGRPEDLDGALLLLVSAAGSFMTGTSLVVDGGHLVSPL
ncbi:NAD(P)-dependent dehydrogenase (Short-subunit alcohol dehydrogenase family) [Hyphomicrobiales bacterium]|nr:NAD(P)-dependent dehydrogenase (Short-subunit alcohol dehydrogenase family) [Hyphomicrobiales bacterium]CAH1694080.1 NAD(P)-dependent dehydrogenase (Short-subunit alcohol dehydrogenase family) [Hyphomicrobiales bacterium]